MNRQVKTIELSGGEYARVPERLRLFREDCPNGSITTKPEFLPDGKIVFMATIVKDKSNPDSAEATGHALGDTKKQKDFEKLETIAVGRALALLGYLASGEVASSEEMEEFNAYRKQQQSEARALAIESIQDAATMDELRKTFLSLGNMVTDAEVIAAKDKRKAELTEI